MHIPTVSYLEYTYLWRSTSQIVHQKDISCVKIKYFGGEWKRRTITEKWKLALCRLKVKGQAIPQGGTRQGCDRFSLTTPCSAALSEGFALTNFGVRVTVSAKGLEHFSSRGRQFSPWGLGYYKAIKLSVFGRDFRGRFLAPGACLQQHVFCFPLLRWNSKHNHIFIQMRMFSKQPLFSSFKFQRVVTERVSTVKHEKGPLAMNKHFDLSMTGLARLCWWGLFVLNLIQNGFQHNTLISGKSQQPKWLNHNSVCVKWCYTDWILRANLEHVK